MSIEADTQGDEAKIRDVVARLRSSPAGKELLDRLASVWKIRIRPTSNAGFLNRDGVVYLGTDGSIDQSAIILAHELEHIRQGVLFNLPMINSFANQWGSVLREAQVWVELGFPAGAKSILYVWTGHPALAHWLYQRGQFEQARSAESGLAIEQIAAFQDYLSRRNQEIGLWRVGHDGDLNRKAAVFGDVADRLEELFDRIIKAPGVLGAKGNFPSGFGDFLETLLSGEVNDEFPLAGMPTARELEAFSYLPIEVLAYQLNDGRWFMRRGNEVSVRSHDLAGRACVLIHNHPGSPKAVDQRFKDRVNFPSDEDLLHQDARLQYLVLPFGVIEYGRPQQIKNPMTGRDWDIRDTDGFQAHLFKAWATPGSWLRKNHPDGSGLPHAYALLGFDIKFRSWSEISFLTCPQPLLGSALWPAAQARMAPLLSETGGMP